MQNTSNIFQQFKTPTPYMPAKSITTADNVQNTSNHTSLTFNKKEKAQLYTAGTITLAGIMMFAGRGFIAKKIFQEPKQEFKPLENLVDDTMLQATEVINNKFKNIITTNLFNKYSVEEIEKYFSLSSGKAKSKIARIINDKFNYGKDLNEKKFISLIESYIQEIFETRKNLEYYETDFINNLSNAYYAVGEKDKAFNLLLNAQNTYKNDLSFPSFKAQEMILYSRDNQHEKALEIWGNYYKKTNFNYDEPLYAIMQSTNAINGPKAAINIFLNCQQPSKKMTDFYIDISIKNGLKNDLLKKLFNPRKHTEYSTRKFLQINKDKLELSDNTLNILDYLEEIYNYESKFFYEAKRKEAILEEIEIYTKLKNEKILDEDTVNNIINTLNSASNNEKYTDELYSMILNNLEFEHPLMKKLYESLNIT